MPVVTPDPAPEAAAKPTGKQAHKKAGSGKSNPAKTNPAKSNSAKSNSAKSGSARSRARKGTAAAPAVFHDADLYSLARAGDLAGLAALGIPALDEETLARLATGDYPRPTFVVADAWSAPNNRVAFATTIDDRDRIGLEALLVSLLAVYPGMTTPFHVLHDPSLSSLAISRLAGLYEGFVFHELPSDDAGQRGLPRSVRAALYALTITGPERLVLVAPDGLVLQDISALWLGDERVKAALATGELPFGRIDAGTGRPIIDPGVVSLPAAVRTRATLAAAVAIAAGLRGPDLESGERALERFWHRLFPEVEIVPNTFNAHPVLVERYLPYFFSQVSYLRLPGMIPWAHLLHPDDRTGADNDARTRAKKSVPRSYALWHDTYSRGITRARSAQFRRERGPRLDALAGALVDRPVVMIGNGPSLQQTDLGLFDGFEKFAFNWFVNHEDFDEVRPDHLVLSSGFFFGGWNTTEPRFPPGFLDKLVAHEHRPTLWVFSYLRDFIESTPELDGFDVEYFLLEKPFNRRFDKLGVPALDLYSALTVAHTGVLAVAVPVAVHMGARRIVLVGCDSNYATTTGSYFYDTAEHTSETSSAEELSRTWDDPDGYGQYTYLRYTQELAARGVTLEDATVGGALTTVPKLPLAEVRSLLAPLRAGA